MMPWSFPSELSKLIENEVSKSITIAETNSRWEGLVNKELCINDEQNSLGLQCTGTGCLEPKVEVMNRIEPIADCNEFDSQYSSITELSNCSGSPVTPSLQKDQGQLFVMSSDDMDKDPNSRHSVNVHDEAYTRQTRESNTESFFKFLLNQSYANMSFCELLHSSLEDSEEEHCKYLDTTYDACLNKIHKSPDLSRFPEPSFVSETAKSEVVSPGQLSYPVDVSLDNELKPFSFRVCQPVAKVPKDKDLLVNTEIPKSSPRATSQDFTDVNMETASASVMDQCSQTDLKLDPKSVDCSSITIDLVQNSWRKLRECQPDLRQHATSEQIGAIEIVKLASGLSDLISEADLLFRNHQQKQCVSSTLKILFFSTVLYPYPHYNTLTMQGIMEPPIFLADDATFSWYDEQMMMSTIAEHGFCFYAKHIVDAGSKVGFENRVDVTSEMLASTINIMAMGKLSRQDNTKTMNNHTKELLEVNNTRNDKKRYI